MIGLSDAAIVALVPAVVELGKRAGLPVKYAGIAAVAVAIALYALRDLAAGPGPTGEAAGWVINGVIAGLVACGLYSQARSTIGRS
jgi:hypothetical protein